MEIGRNLKNYLIIPLIAGILLLLSTGFKPMPQQQALPEYQVKAVFLYNFSQFIQWPDSSFTDEGSPFVIGVLGKNPFGPYLQEAVENELINNHPFEIKYFDTVNEVEDCHILYINEKDKEKIQQILKLLRGRDILTVGENRQFGEMGGVVTFVKDKGKIKLKINQQSAEKARLQISSKLLSLAEIVSTEQGDE